MKIDFKKKMKMAGFTLIELMVVVSIISLLSSVILAALTTARARATDSKIIQQFVNLRNSAEIYYTNNSNSYGTSASCISGMFSNIPLSSITATTKNCGSNGTQYSIAISLVNSAPKLAWCIDSSGISRGQTAGGVDYTAVTGSATAAHTVSGQVFCN